MPASSDELLKPSTRRVNGPEGGIFADGHWRSADKGDLPAQHRGPCLTSDENLNGNALRLALVPSLVYVVEVERDEVLQYHAQLGERDGEVGLRWVKVWIVVGVSSESAKGIESAARATEGVGVLGKAKPCKIPLGGKGVKEGDHTAMDLVGSSRRARTLAIQRDRGLDQSPVQVLSLTVGVGARISGHGFFCHCVSSPGEMGWDRHAPAAVLPSTGGVQGDLRVHQPQTAPS